MKTYGSNYIKVGKFIFIFGYSFKRFGFGFCISQWNADIDLGFFWLGVEW